MRHRLKNGPIMYPINFAFTSSGWFLSVNHCLVLIVLFTIVAWELFFLNPFVALRIFALWSTDFFPLFFLSFFLPMTYWGLLNVWLSFFSFLFQSTYILFQLMTHWCLLNVWLSFSSFLFQSMTYWCLLNVWLSFSSFHFQSMTCWCLLNVKLSFSFYCLFFSYGHSFQFTPVATLHV